MHTHSKQTMSQYDKMIETPIPPLICSLAIPTIISMLVTSIYNMADTYFVSQLGTSAAGAVGIVFSLMAVIQAVGFTLGMGSGSLSSRLLGQKRQEEVNQICSSGLFAAAALGLTITVLGSLFLNPLMNLLGATHRYHSPLCQKLRPVHFVWCAFYVFLFRYEQCAAL